MRARREGTGHAALERTLRSIPGVRSVEVVPVSGTQWIALRLTPGPGTDVREAAAAAAEAAGFAVRRLEVETASLERVFASIIESPVA